MSKKKRKKTFADRAKDIMNKESDPSLQQGLLEDLKNEMEAYKEVNGMNQSQEQAQPQQQPGMQEFATGGFGLQTGFNEGLGVGLSNQFNNDPMINMFRNSNTWGDLGSGREAFAADGGIGDGGSMTNLNQRQGSNSGNWFQNSPGAQNAAGFGMQMIPSIASGLTSFIGNRMLQKQSESLAEQAKNDYTTMSSPEHTKARLISSKKISLTNERNEARREASDAKRTSQSQIKRASRSRGEYLAGAGISSAATSKVLGSILGKSYSNQAQMNANRENADNQYNAQSLSSNDKFNAGQDQFVDNWNAGQKQGGLNRYYDQLQQAAMYQQGQIGALTGAMGDATKISANNQMINSLGDRYGYDRENWMTPNDYKIKYEGRNQS